MAPSTKQRARAKRWSRYLKIAGEAGTIAMSLRDRPTPLDWFGVGLRAIGIALTVRDERRRAEARDPYQYFTDLGSGEWIEVPEEFRRLVLDHAIVREVDERFWDGEEGSPFLCRAKIDGELVAWVGEANAILDGPYILKAREIETYRVLGDRLWRKFGGCHLHYGSSGLVLDPFDGTGIIATTQMRGLATRVRRFLDVGVARSYLLAGQPGTGKSMTIRWIIEHLGLTSVRIDLGVLARLHGYGGGAIATSLETLLRLLRPRVMILDDLDRIRVTAPLLTFLELAQRTCSVVIASANSVDRMMGAAIRPGRFDEIITVERLDPEVLRRLLADDGDLFERLAELPAAYVIDLVKRIRVLGREHAVTELDELVSRSAKIASAPEADD